MAATFKILKSSAILTSNYTKLSKRYIYKSTTDLKSFKNWYRSLWAPKIVKPPYYHVTQIGDPVLRQKSSPVPVEAITSREVNNLIENMIDVMHHYKCVGLAAPQIGIPLRIIVLEFTDKSKNDHSVEIQKTKQMETLPLTVLINPEMKVTNYNKITFPEACESVRGFRADVPRYEEVCINAQDRNGIFKELKLNGWSARIAQHEMDHLNGTMYTDIMNRKSFICSCWQAVNSNKGEIIMRFLPR